MTLSRKLGVGDIIECKGTRAEIKEIISQDAYTPKSGEGSYVYIEFIDTRGNYRNWKSDIDGGTVKYKSDEYLLLRYYYDKYTGRYVIPFNEVNDSISEEIMKILSRGYAMSAFDDCGDLHYCIYSLSSDSEGFSPINKCRDVLARIESKFNCKYCTKFSIDNYNDSVASLIDTVLVESSDFKNHVDDYSIALIFENNYFKFIEVLNACI